MQVQAMKKASVLLFFFQPPHHIWLQQPQVSGGSGVYWIVLDFTLLTRSYWVQSSYKTLSADSIQSTFYILDVEKKTF